MPVYKLETPEIYWPGSFVASVQNLYIQDEFSSGSNLDCDKLCFQYTLVSYSLPPPQRVLQHNGRKPEAEIFVYRKL
jgi:hypothetical protein